MPKRSSYTMPKRSSSSSAKRSSSSAKRSSSSAKRSSSSEITKRAMQALRSPASMKVVSPFSNSVEGTIYLLSAALAAAFVYYLYALGQQPDSRTKCKDILPGLRKLMYVVAVFELVVLCLGLCAILVFFGLIVMKLGNKAFNLLAPLVLYLAVYAIIIAIPVYIIRYTTAVAESKDTVKDQCTKIQANFRLFLMVLFGLAVVLEGGKGVAMLCR